MFLRGVEMKVADGLKPAKDVGEAVTGRTRGCRDGIVKGRLVTEEEIVWGAEDEQGTSAAAHLELGVHDIVVTLRVAVVGGRKRERQRHAVTVGPDQDVRVHNL